MLLLASNSKWKIFSKFCVLLRKSKLYLQRSLNISVLPLQLKNRLKLHCVEGLILDNSFYDNLSRNLFFMQKFYTVLPCIVDGPIVIPLIIK